jgi:hypothetical protein
MLASDKVEMMTGGLLGDSLSSSHCSGKSAESWLDYKYGLPGYHSRVSIHIPKL